jgi:hypothetical protein
LQINCIRLIFGRIIVATAASAQSDRIRCVLASHPTLQYVFATTVAIIVSDEKRVRGNSRGAPARHSGSLRPSISQCPHAVANGFAVATHEKVAEEASTVSWRRRLLA